jgi:predicted acylesterase/phospholipase RssA
MNMKINRSVASALLAGGLLLGVVLACGSADETDQANKLVAEGNSAIDEGKKFFKDAEEKKNQMLQTNVSQLAEARTLANEAIRGYDQAEEKAKEAAGKFEEASKLKISDKFKEYLTLKVKEFNKRAELIEAARGIPQALIDSQSRSAFISRANAATQKGDRLNQEASDLSDQADKIQKDNPDAFKKSS